MVGVLAGVVLLTLAGVGLVGGFGGRDTSAPPVAAEFASPVPAAMGPSPAAATSGVTPSARPSGTATAAPTLLSLPGLKVSAGVDQVVTTNGVLGVPDDPARVGWWTGSARPGAAAGSVVIDGHVDSATRGIGALFHLTQLQAGAPVHLTGSDGTRWSYRVYARQVYSKHQPLPAELFTRSGPARLVLITCGGAFDAAARSYQDNIVVLAALQRG